MSLYRFIYDYIIDILKFNLYFDEHNSNNSYEYRNILSSLTQNSYIMNI